MPRFTGQNKKFIDPRYFLNEKTDKKSVKEQEESLATLDGHQEIVEHDSEDLNEEDYAFLENIHKHLSAQEIMFSGPRFANVMEKLGVSLGGSQARQPSTSQEEFMYDRDWPPGYEEYSNRHRKNDGMPSPRPGGYSPEKSSDDRR